MKHVRIAMLMALLLAACPLSQTFACGGPCCGGSSEMQSTVYSVPVTAQVGDLASLGMHTLATGLKQSAHVLGDLPRMTRHQVAAHSPQVRSSFRRVADRTSDLVQQLSVEVTSLSLQLLRNVFSSIWALVSGLLLS
jgi:hypothetical protein